MTTERDTQDRVIALFRDELGYTVLGNWKDRTKNGPIEDSLLESYLLGAGYSSAQINKAILTLKQEAELNGRKLYEVNQAITKRLRFGLPVKIEAGKVTETVHLINWKEPKKNHFALAEEVTLRGNRERRPDLVLYVNGLALGVLELKNSRVSVGEGIRQSLSNQGLDFNAAFFSTVQFIFAGNDAEGLRYGPIGTGEKYFLTWKEDEADDSRGKLDKYLLKLCAPERFLELIHDFVLFDGGVKKLPRVHQYFGIKAAQEFVRRREGGIIWHTQGAGKSIVMVLLAKWILEKLPQARVAVITDRDELDKQIQRVFTDSGETIQRSRSGQELMSQLGQPTPRLLCSLVHKFGLREVTDFEAYLKDLAKQPSATVGEVFVFVDECHRTQSGRLHRAMKAMMPNAVFIGFTGTPLLKDDKATSNETFGRYIHTYKFSEAVEDGVVLDLVYEARDIDQKISSQEKIDQWFEAKTRGLNNWQKDQLKQQWGTMQAVLSSRSRMEKVVADILFDFSVKPRLSSERGNAMLVASSIYEACKYFSLFQKTPMKGRCAIVTSYDPQSKDVSKEETGANTETDKQFIFNTYTELLKDVQAGGRSSKTEAYEDAAKADFRDKPAQMKLLIVVDKLLTGFDAPPCSYLYIDKSMQDHGLFQAICRTNRLDGDDKDFGYIVDYKDLFKKVEKTIEVYTSELDRTAGGGAPDVSVQDRLKKGRERLDQMLESFALHCEPVLPPKDDLAAIRHFCGNTEIASELEAKEVIRSEFYKAVAILTRAYAAISDELLAAGYSDDEAKKIKARVEQAVKLRETIRLASGETLDLKPYEADMRHLIDTYLQADEPKKISPFDGLGLLELIVKTGIASAVAALPEGIRGSPESVAETIANNVRRKIIKDRLSDPAYYERMSQLLDEVLSDLRAKRIEYAEYLKRIADLASRVQAGPGTGLPPALNTAGKRALFNNLQKMQEDGWEVAMPAPNPYADEAEDPVLRLTEQIDRRIKDCRPHDWRGHPARESVIKSALYQILQDKQRVETLFAIIKQQAEY